MLKIINGSANVELVKACSGQMASLVNFDSRTGVKSASEGFPKGILEQHRPDKDHFAMHIIAVGDGELFSCNRNGDYFSKKANEEFHPCFVKFGHYFLHHKNSDPKLAVGIIKASCHNAPMGRIELIIHGDKKKDEEGYEMVKAGKQICGSMSCKVPGDFCSICSHFATKRADYCDHAAYELGKIYPDGRQVYVDNRTPYFFDYSRVGRPADRIAWGMQYLHDGAGDMAKTAAEKFFCGADLAKQAGIVEPEIVAAMGNEIVSMNKLNISEKLAEIEQKVDHAFATKTAGDWRMHAIRSEFPKAILASREDPITEEEMQKMASIEPLALFEAMAKRAMIFSFQDFVRYVKNMPATKVASDETVLAAEKYFIPGLFKKSCPEHCSADSLFDGEAADCQADPIQALMDRVAARHTLQPSAAKKRMMIISIDCRHVNEPKSAADIKAASNMSPEFLDNAKNLAAFYGLYKISALSRMQPEQRDEELLTLSVLQNRI